MSWNYRVMRRDGELAIHEVHYDEDGRVQGYGAEPTFPGGPDLDELRANLQQYASALDEPVLEYEDDSPRACARDAAGEATPDGVWVFVGNKASLPSGVFADLAEAERWIARHAMSGLLTRYPVGAGVFEWATDKGYFKPKPEKVIDGHFVSRFTCASMAHHHYEAGRCVG